MHRIGLISDTHGLLRPEALTFLRGCDAIVHGGDIGHEDILNGLAQLATVTAVRGNNDNGTWAERIRDTERLKVGGIGLYAVHDLARLDIQPASAGVHVVISGHSHKPKIETRDGVLYINPGSAGPRRFKLPITAGELLIDGNAICARVVDLLDNAFPELVST